jgi:hypothetical protein
MSLDEMNKYIGVKNLKFLKKKVGTRKNLVYSKKKTKCGAYKIAW